MPTADKRQRKKENARLAREAREAEAKKRRRNRTLRNAGIAVVVFAAVLTIVTLTTHKKKKAASTTTTTTTIAYPAGCVSTVPKTTPKPTYTTTPKMTIDVNKTYVAHFTSTCGAFDITLDPKVAPQTVNSFVFLAKNGFYDGLTFHRVVKDFVVQGGDPKGDGSGGPGYKLATEPPKNGYKAGSVAMANSGPDTTGSQFFLVLSANGAKALGGPPYLYSELGTVTKGFDAATRMGSLADPNASGTDPAAQKPTRPLYIFKVTITES